MLGQQHRVKSQKIDDRHAEQTVAGFAGHAYGALAVVSGLYMVQLAIAVFRTRQGDAARKACYRLFGVSIIYLLALYAVLLAEHATGLFARTGW